MDDFEPSSTRKVALRKESVDRNISPHSISYMILVALRKESVDRNFLLRRQGRRLGGRSPQGERG